MIKASQETGATLGIRPFAVVLQNDRFNIASLPDALPFECKEVDSWEQVFRRLSSFRPGCLLVDFDHEREEMLNQVRYFADHGIRFSMVGVSADQSKKTLQMAFRCGFTDLVNRPIERRQLIESVEEAFRSDGRGVDSLCEIRSCFGKLTPKEREMLPALLKGVPSRKLASLHHVTYQTIDRHRKHVIEKMKVDNMTELAMKLYRQY
ncbi:LuxR C-terminal-related transcriptional regulator [Roseiconus lacunae]|uniref:LuxR C-terminal-related transcriptional regulator n=1 Tax=Roseiconus lacunae TaxID=2605694 RepID=A0ABT7PPE8_9BACT|nr:LuxR C-terminal-related transcriptional regulator [Roseiconus lacunae]MCD0458934.1 LuxR C-terminal-related transcriptional regulator [Roseiconus lacunae]MDM4018375.1 LuxR C-terminal-related transcriptional regulator [Roseiconus lacunae]WRQ49244.1 LuxR C-terminal-related transcriptional regulator [Stieleria sp. HD01]